MSKKNTVKIGGFIATLAVGAALVSAAATGTGAYFQDSENGGLTATSGHLDLTTSNAYLDFADLIPGEDTVKNIDYRVDSSGKSDVWLKFNPNDAAYSTFTGKNGDNGTKGGLGSYGHFAASNNGAVVFQSYNLATGSDGKYCDVTTNGTGGSSAQVPTNGDNKLPYCAVPSAIRVASDLDNGTTGTLNVTFGLTGKAEGQNATWASVPFKVVATQAGQKPSAK